MADNVTKLPVGFKKPAGEMGRSLKVVPPYVSGECNHQYVWKTGGEGLGQMVNVTYLLREGETEVECSECKAKLDPVWVLRQLALKESQWQETRKNYQQEMERLRPKAHQVPTLRQTNQNQPQLGVPPHDPPRQASCAGSR